MKNRTSLYCIVGVVLAAVLISAATNLAAGGKLTGAAWMRAQQHTPLLWMVDGCGVIIFLISWMLGAALAGLQGQSVSQTDENARHIEVLTETLQDLFRQNSDYAARIEALEDAGDNWHEGFDEEARRLTETAFRALADNIESNATQLEAINLALRYHRAEMRAMRTAFKTGALEPPSGEAPALDPVGRPARPILPEWQKPAMPIAISAEPDEPAITAEPGAEAEPEGGLGDPIVAASESINAEADVHVEEASQGAATGEDGEDVEEDEPAAALGSSEAESELEHDDTNADDLSEPTSEHTASLAVDHTVNNGSTVVETLDLDLSTGTAVVVEAEPESSSQARAAEEFRRSKAEPLSIFRRKRR